MARRGLLVGLILVLGLTGCGVSRSGAASDEGDAAAIAAAATDADRKTPPSPDDANSPDGLVRDFLKAAVGGGKAGTEQVKRFLNDHAKLAWRDAPDPDNPPMTVIRLVGAPSILAVSEGRTPVRVDYQVVGELSDRGRVDELDPGTSTPQMTFYVVADENNRSSLRIDEIAGGESGLMISDEALTEYYRSQPIYFWDAGYTALVPDIRYVPLTEPADVRAGRLVKWLAAGWSSWIFGVVGLGLNPTPDPVVSSNGALVVKFSSEAQAVDDDKLRRLLFQLQWTLRTGTTPNVQIVVDDKVAEVKAAADEYLNFNRTWNYRLGGQRYDITNDRKVVPSPATPSTPPVLAAAENANVSAAAITLQGNLAAFVHTNPNGRKSLQFVREGAPPVESKLGNLTEIGRPVFVPDSHESVLVIANLNANTTNRLYAVSSVDGSYSEVTRGGGIVSFSVSPDGRRIAYVTTSGQVAVASLSVANVITISTTSRPILSGQINASTVVWTSESWLTVAGTVPGTTNPALWRVTADSVVGQNISDTLKGIQVTDLVAYPQLVARPYADILGTSKDGGVYSFFNAPAPETGLKAPFFAAS